MALAPTTPADQSICTPICVGRSRGSTRSTRTAAQNSAGSWTPSIGTKPTAPTHSPTSNHTLRHRDYCSHLYPATTRKLHATPRHLSRCHTQRWLGSNSDRNTPFVAAVVVVFAVCCVAAAMTELPQWQQARRRQRRRSRLLRSPPESTNAQPTHPRHHPSTPP